MHVVAKIWKSADETNVDISDAALEEWGDHLQICWLNNAFPTNVTDILMDPDFHSIDDESDKMNR